MATLIKFLSGWLVTVPLAALFVFLLHINLQGLVAAVTVGYSVSSTALMYLLIRSNWDKRVEKVKRATVKDYEEYQDSPVRGSPIEVLMKERTSSDGGDSLPTIIAEQIELTPTGVLT